MCVYVRVQVEAIKYIFACLDEPEAVEHDLRRLAPALLEPATVCVYALGSRV